MKKIINKHFAETKNYQTTNGENFFHKSVNVKCDSGKKLSKNFAEKQFVAWNFAKNNQYKARKERRNGVWASL